MLEQSLSAAPQAETWHNLSVVCLRLGELDLAAKAKGPGIRDDRRSGRAFAACAMARRDDLCSHWPPASDLSPRQRRSPAKQPAEKPAASKKSAAYGRFQKTLHADSCTEGCEMIELQRTPNSKPRSFPQQSCS